MAAELNEQYKISWVVEQHMKNGVEKLDYEDMVNCGDLNALVNNLKRKFGTEMATITITVHENRCNR